MMESFSFVLLFVMPVIVGYVVYKIMTYDTRLWNDDIERMRDDMW